jgi:hypothetical protein
VKPIDSILGLSWGVNDWLFALHFSHQDDVKRLQFNANAPRQHRTYDTVVLPITSHAQRHWKSAAPGFLIRSEIANE